MRKILQKSEQHAISSSDSVIPDADERGNSEKLGHCVKAVDTRNVKLTRNQRQQSVRTSCFELFIRRNMPTYILLFLFQLYGRALQGLLSYIQWLDM